MPEEYRCWCEECGWEDTAPSQEAAARLITLGHGVATDHADTYMKPVGEIDA